MLFNSDLFIFLFLPLTLLGWFLLNHLKQYRFAEAFLLGMSLWFYSYFHLNYLWIILASIAGNYLISLAMEYKKHSIFMWAGILYNLGLLFYFKYFDFFLENLNLLFPSGEFVLRGILMPLGISFFTFQQLSYIIDRAKGEAPHYPFLLYANFITFFPQLIAGPIVLHTELVPRLTDLSVRRPTKEGFAAGIQRFVLGLSKKVLLADPLSLVVDYGFDKVWYLDTVSAIIVVFTYAFQMYFDFSGYCDMAIGIGRMFNITLPENFNSPYKSESIQEHWQRWHMTLTRFFTKYVYIPLGGSRKGELRTILNILLVFLLSGLWHGANWTFVLWGLLQGIACVVNRKGFFKGLPGPLMTLGTFTYFALSMAVFRSPDLSLALEMFRHIFTPAWTGFLPELASAFAIPEAYVFTQALTLKAPGLLSAFYLCLFGLWFMVSILVLRGKNAAELTAEHEEKGYPKGYALLLAFLFAWSVVSLSKAGPFLYFNF